MTPPHFRHPPPSLRDSTDRFSTIADYFGRDLFGGGPAPPPLEEDSDTDTD